MIDQKTIIDLCYILASIFFIFGLKMLSSPKTARKGNLISSFGMLIAVVATLFAQGMAFQWIILGFVAGGVIGVLAAFLVKMTSMPEMVALFNGSGGVASLFVGWAEFIHNPEPNTVTLVAIGFAVLIGGITFTGSILAYGKLSGKVSGNPFVFPGQKFINIILIAAGFVGAVAIVSPELRLPLFYGVLVLSLVLGIITVMPIGGADMPVVIALLNSYSGLAACAAGFVISNTVLIVAGSLVGASGLILTNIMCKAMNRSLVDVLKGGVGGAVSGGGQGVEGEAKPITPADTYYILEAARNVIFVPGYGMAVAQAQHAARELGELLEENGAEVNYAIHPVAGRMPGHMNVLLAEADVEYEKLIVPEDVNPNMQTVDVAIVVGANDVVNPAARTDKASPLYGMPIIDVDKAKTVIVLKRSLNPGFSGVQNPLFFLDNTRMLFGDAKASLTALVGSFKEE